MPSRKAKSRKPKVRTISLFLALIFLMTGMAWGEEQAAEENPAPQDQMKVGQDVTAAENRPQDQSEVREAILTALKQVNTGSKKKSRSSGVAVADGGVVKVEPGRNVTLTVAGDQLNRIVTPFTNPLVHKVDKAKVSVDGSVVYVALAQEAGPTSMFITENGESDPSISLTLVPHQMPPREIRLQLAGGGPVVSVSGKSAKWEKSQPYTEALEKLMLRTARGEVPPGYSFHNPPVGASTPRCRMPVRIEPRQVLEGHNFQVVISKLTNISSSQLQVDESACYQEGVRAVSVWPLVNLAPRQSTELYVVYQREMGQKPSRRPNVLYQRPAETICEPEPPKKVRPRWSEPEPIAVSEVLQTPRPMSANQP